MIYVTVIPIALIDATKCSILALSINANTKHLDASISAMPITVTHVIQYLICTRPQFIKIGCAKYL